MLSIIVVEDCDVTPPPFSCSIHLQIDHIPHHNFKMNRSTLFLIAAMSTSALQCSEAFAPSPSSVVSTRSRVVVNGFFIRRRRGLVDNNESKDSTDDADATLPKASRLRNSRRSFLSTGAATAATASLFPLRSVAAFTPSTSAEKLTNISDADLKQIILSDMVDKSFLVTADITRSVYDESATFTDEIDVYTMDKWIKGTQALFVASGSRVSLVGDVNVTPSEVTFRFDEDLMFNIPFKPVCSLTGKVVLTRDESTGLITSYREYWDQSVNDVLKTAKFGKKA